MFYLMGCELCEDHEASREKRRVVSHSPAILWVAQHETGWAGWHLHFLLPPHLPVQTTRWQDKRVSSMLNPSSFSQDKQQRMTIIGLMWCFSNCGPPNSLKLYINEWKGPLHWNTQTRVSWSPCAVKQASVFLWLTIKGMASIKSVWYLL